MYEIITTVLEYLLIAFDECALLVMAPLYKLLGMLPGQRSPANMHCRGETELQRSENYDEH